LPPALTQLLSPHTVAADTLLLASMAVNAVSVAATLTMPAIGVVPAL
jgi:hypothetical protein